MIPFNHETLKFAFLHIYLFAFLCYFPSRSCSLQMIAF